MSVIAEEKRFNELLEEAYSKWSNNFTEAKNLSEDALEIAISLEKPELILKAYNSLAISYWYITDITTAKEYALEGLKYLNDVKADGPKSTLYNTLGMIHFGHNDYYKSFEYYLRALRLENLSKLTDRIISAVINIFGIFFGLGTRINSRYNAEIINDIFTNSLDFHPVISKLLSGFKDITPETYSDFAVEMMKDLVKFSKKGEDRVNIYNNIALLSLQKGDYSQARECMDKALEIASSNKFSTMLANILLNFANLEKETGNINSSVKMNLKAMKLAESLHQNEYLSRAYKELASLFSQRKRYKKSAEFLEKYIAIRERMLRQQKNDQLNNLLAKYESEKNAQQFKITKQELEIYKLRTFELESMVHERTEKILAMEKYYEVGKFSASIVHNLKGPLSAIIGATALLELALEKGMTQQKINEYLEILKKSNNDMLHMIMSITRDGMTRDKSQDVQLDINNIIEEQLNLHLISDAFKAIVVKSQLSSHPIMVFGRKIHFKQIFSNLFSNAAEAMELSENKILTITSRIENNRAVVMVRDTGSGIHPDILKKIFDTNFTTKGSKRGTGLGLSITKQMIESYKGSISVNSQIDSGTEFKVSIPLAQ